jgi:hypothetical protein
MNYKFIQRVNSGFFSDFNVIIGCLDYIITNKISNFNFVWNNAYYQNNNENLFFKYFFNTLEYDNYDYQIEAITIGATYYQPFNERERFINSHNVLTHFNYFNNPVFVQLKNQCVKSDNCLGIHVRGTDHWQHGPLIDLAVYFEYIDSKLELGKYNKIFLATDEERHVQSFKQRYGDKVITNSNITRSNTSAAIHRSGYQDKEKLIIDVMLDAISLAQCNEIIITSSNVSAYTLAINPYIKYTFVDLPH